MSEPKPKRDDGDDFEEVVSALLKVDPTGLSGKHKKKRPEKDDDPEG